MSDEPAPKPGQNWAPIYTPKAAQMIPKLVDEYRAWVNELETILSPDGIKRGLVSDRDIARARAQLRKRLGGNIIVTEASDEIRFETEASVDEMSLRMAGNGSQVFMVAGARFGNNLRHTVRLLTITRD